MVILIGTTISGISYQPTGATSGAGTAYLSGALEFTPFLRGFVLLDL
jgi:hypothetical protein